MPLHISDKTQMISLLFLFCGLLGGEVSGAIPAGGVGAGWCWVMPLQAVLSPVCIDALDVVPLCPQGADAPVGDVRAVPGHAPDQPAVRAPAAQLRGVHHHESAAAAKHR